MNKNNTHLRHEQRMVLKKNIIDEKIAQANIEKGVIVITAGNGKEKVHPVSE